MREPTAETPLKQLQADLSATPLASEPTTDTPSKQPPQEAQHRSSTPNLSSDSSASTLRPLIAQTPADLTLDEPEDFDSNSFDSLEVSAIMPVNGTFMTLQPPSPATPPPPTTGPRKKCTTVYLAGAATATGHGSAFAKCACAQLRCTKCDFQVLRISGRRWSSRVDYLFLRNHMPLMDRLQPMLEPDPEACAYACQCSWRTVEAVAKLTPKDDLRWVCAGH